MPTVVGSEVRSSVSAEMVVLAAGAGVGRLGACGSMIGAGSGVPRPALGAGAGVPLNGVAASVGVGKLGTSDAESADGVGVARVAGAAGGVGASGVAACGDTARCVASGVGRPGSSGASGDVNTGDDNEGMEEGVDVVGAAGVASGSGGAMLVEVGAGMSTGATPVRGGSLSSSLIASCCSGAGCASLMGATSVLTARFLSVVGMMRSCPTSPFP